MTIDEFLGRLNGVTKNGAGWKSRCPAHDDHKPSLSVAEGDNGGIVVKCFVGCTEDAIVAALGIDRAELFPPNSDGDWTPFGPALAIYDYTDEERRLLFQVCRTAAKQFPCRVPDPGEKSGWRWKLGDTRRVLYRLPAVIEAAAAGETIYVVEGEKDVHTAERAGVTATTNPGGASKNKTKWRPEFTEQLSSAESVVIVADRDEAGRSHARQVAAALELAVPFVSIVQAAAGNDLSDHLAAGLTLDELVPLDESDDEPTVTLEPEPGSFDDRVRSRRVDLFARLESGPTPICYLPASEGMLVRGKRHHAPAPKKTGKSFGWLCHTVDMTLAGATVVILDRENGADEYARRLGHILQSRGLTDDQRAWVRTGLRYYEFPKIRDYDHADLAAEMAEVDLVIFDSQRRFLTDLGLKENESDDYTAFAAATIDVLFEHGIATLIQDNTGHLEKDRGRGSSAKADLNEVAFVLETVDAYSEGRVGKIRLKIEPGASRFGNEGTWEMVIGGGVFGSWQPVATEDLKAERNDDALDWITTYVNEHPGEAKTAVTKAFAEAHGGRGRNLAATVIDRDLAGSTPTISRGPGKSPSGVYLYPASQLNFPLPDTTTGNTGNHPDGATPAGQLPVLPGVKDTGKWEVPDEAEIERLAALAQEASE
jgi:hypothetical protein